MDEDRFGRLSERELETLRLAAEGLKPKVIAQRLVLSERTVYTHLNNAARRVGATSYSEAAMALARREALGPYAKSTEQVLPIARGGPLLIELLLPELSGRPFNDLTLTHRLAVILSRAAIIAFILFAVVSLVREIGQMLATHA